MRREPGTRWPPPRSVAARSLPSCSPWTTGPAPSPASRRAWRRRRSTSGARMRPPPAAARPRSSGWLRIATRPSARSSDARVRLKRDEVERMMAARPPGTTLEEVLEVFEVFASGTLADEVYVLDDVAGKRIAIAPAALKAKYRKE